MTNLSAKTALTALLFLGIFSARAQFVGPYVVSNWGTVQNNSDGTTNTSGAPASISMTSGDNGSGFSGTNDFTVTILQSGLISFDWDYSTGDDPAYDWPEYVINGTSTMLSSYDTFGNLIQSGSETCISVQQGDVFAFRMYTDDNDFGRATTVFSAFSFSAGITITPTAAVVCAGEMITLTAGGGTSYNWNNGVTNGVPFNAPNFTTNYVVTGMVGACNTVANATVTILPSPVLSVSGNPGTACSGTSLVLSVSGANSYAWSSGSTTSNYSLTAQNTMSFDVVGTIGTCTSVVQQTIMVIPSPTVTITGPNQICNGSTAVLTASGSADYIWNTLDQTASINLSPNTTTTYSVLGTTNGCSSTVFHTVVVNPLPAVSLNSSKSIICAGEAVTLTAGGANTYSWSNSATNTGSTVSTSPSVTTSYTVYGTDVNGCKDTESFIQIVESCAGISSRENNATLFSFFPNPASALLYIDAGNNMQAFVLTDSKGALMLSGKTDKGLNQINIEHLSNGIYFIKAIHTDGAAPAVKKLIVNR